jgi:peptidoglycan/LPS O-acetylase OafA/YrhL
VPDVPISQTLLHSILAVFFTGVVLWATLAETRNTRAARLLSHPTLRFLGRYSYAIYVVHQPIANALAPRFEPLVHDPSFPLAAAALMGDVTVVGTASVGVALVSWHAFEKRFLALKDQLAPRGVRAWRPRVSCPFRCHRPPLCPLRAVLAAPTF